jgi:hypothetical protein
MLLSGLLAVSAYSAVPAQAETLNLSFAEAAITGYDGCVATAPGWRAKDPYETQDVNGCHVDFAIPVTVGHSIKQIKLLYGIWCQGGFVCADPNLLDVSSYLVATTVTGPNAGHEDYFYYWSSQGQGLNQIDGNYAQSLMPLFASFTTQADTVYRVSAEVHNFFFVSGLQITYN